MINRTTRFTGILAIAALGCVAGLAADLNVSVTSGGSPSVTVVPCGGTVDYEVTAILSDTLNEGLAAVLFELDFSGGPLQPADAPTADPLLNFQRPAGVSGPDGLGGTIMAGRLVMLGGAQNVINNTPDVAPFPIGTVIPYVGHSAVVIVTGTLTAPAEAGVYTLSLTNLVAAVIKQGETGVPIWATEPAGVGSITNLTITVPPADQTATAANDSPVCENGTVALLGGPDGMAAYAWTGPGGFTSVEQNPIVSPALPGTYILTITDSNDCLGTARTFIDVVPMPCVAWFDCNENTIHDDCDIFAGTSADTNANGIPDECDADCNTNGVPDDIDISSGTSEDCTGNGTPDECEPDCNTNGIADSCDIADGTSQDCNANGLPDDCDLAAGTSQDCNENDILDDCDIAAGLSADCNDNGIPDECELAAGDSQDCNANGVPDECDIADGTSDDCTGDGIPDECEPDCNTNGIADSCDIAFGGSDDCDNNGVPDECDIASGAAEDCNANGILDTCELDSGLAEDCNTNGVLDECDIAAGVSQDCNANGIPDDCEPLEDCNANGIQDICDLAAGTSQDCNANGIPDDCDIAAGDSQDCNGNDIPDECDIAGGFSQDCNANDVPDDCDLAVGTSPDCNTNDIPDECDISGGTSEDCNHDGVPDECQLKAVTWRSWKQHGGGAGRLGIDLPMNADGDDAALEPRWDGITELTVEFSQAINVPTVTDVIVTGCEHAAFSPDSVAVDGNTLTLYFPAGMDNGQEDPPAADRYTITLMNVTSAATGAGLICDRDVEVIVQYGNVYNVGASAGRTDALDFSEILAAHSGGALVTEANCMYDIHSSGASAGKIDAIDANRALATPSELPLCGAPIPHGRTLAPAPKTKMSNKRYQP